MKKYFLISIAILYLVLFTFSCSRSSAPQIVQTTSIASISPEEKLLVDYEKYVNDIIAEYIKIDAGDSGAYNNIAPLSEIGTELKLQIVYTDFNDEQRSKLEKIEEKRKDFFNNR